jgi:hypothetical protein
VVPVGLCSIGYEAQGVAAVLAVAAFTVAKKSAEGLHQGYGKGFTDI